MSGFHFEAGSFNGPTFGATAVFETIGWTGLLVEPHPSLFRECQKNRPRSVVVQVALGASGEQGQVAFTCVDFGEHGSALSFRSAYAEQEHTERCIRENGRMQELNVDVISLDQVLSSVASHVDLLVLDIEGHELNVLKGFTLSRFSQRVLMAEIHFCAADAELRGYLESRGYCSAGVIGCNELFSTTSEVEFVKQLVNKFLSGDMSTL